MTGTFLQVMLFRDEREAYRIGPAIWAALKEVSTLYNFGKERANFRRCFLSPKSFIGFEQEVDLDPRKIHETLASKDWWNRLSPATAATSSGASDKLFSDADAPLLLEALGPEAEHLYEAATEEFHDMVDKNLVVEQVRQLIGPEAATAPLLLVIDQELIPPPSWHYIIWDDVDWEGNRAVVVSMRPTDPRYWGMLRTKQVSSVTKQRVRAACCSAVGEILNFERCGNPSCYLYRHVDSVSMLDDMNHFGEEHDVPELSGMGYLGNENNPWDVEALLHIAESSEEDKDAESK